jgi:hypothetical protein
MGFLWRSTFDSIAGSSFPQLKSAEQLINKLDPLIPLSVIAKIAQQVERFIPVDKSLWGSNQIVGQALKVECKLSSVYSWHCT